MQQPLITLEVKLLPGKKGIIEYTIAKWNDTAFENKFSTASKGEIITLKLIEMKQETTV